MNRIRDLLLDELRESEGLRQGAVEYGSTIGTIEYSSEGEDSIIAESPLMGKTRITIKVERVS